MLQPGWGSGLIIQFLNLYCILFFDFVSSVVCVEYIQYRMCIYVQYHVQNMCYYFKSYCIDLPPGSFL